MSQLIPPILPNVNNPLQRDSTIDDIKHMLNELEITPYNKILWRKVLELTKEKSFSSVEMVYNQFFELYPDCGKFLSQLITHQLYENQSAEVTKYFDQRLEKCHSGALWSVYLDYQERTHQLPESLERINPKELQEKIQIVLNSYERFEKGFGSDPSSGEIWMLYVNYLERIRDIAPIEKRLITVIEKAITIPNARLDELMKLYNMCDPELVIQQEQQLQFEQKKNKKQKFSEKEHQRFQTTDPNILKQRFKISKEIYQIRKRYLEQIDSDTIFPTPLKGSEGESKKLQLWHELITFEKSNPLKLQSKEQLFAEVCYFFDEALLFWPYFPSLWIDAIEWCCEHSKLQLARRYHDEGIKHNPCSPIITFTLAEWYELEFEKIDLAREMWLSQVNSEIGLINCLRAIQRIDGKLAAKCFFVEYKDQIPSPAGPNFYVEMARIEYKINKNHEDSRNIFEIGIQHFIQNPNFVLAYIDFLENLGEEKNLRVLFERVLKVMSKYHSLIIWKKFLQFEYNYHDLKRIQEIEKKISSIFGNIECNSLPFLQSRLKYKELTPLDEPFNSVFHKAINENEMGPNLLCFINPIKGFYQEKNRFVIDTQQIEREEKRKQKEKEKTQLPEIVEKFLDVLPKPEMFTSKLFCFFIIYIYMSF
ncbi:RNA cleavage stimulation factor [Anaeramoeba flamelloides]|uniref:RNA cleavage stimulation factor n=1 Tax=Anaeramoeba flamelloides TaxID=1746091 RepID=A0AAV7ZPI9_9EUKA|nr:RNA cleavage stimulation factor [Anaeramoeba flamelloides]